MKAAVRSTYGSGEVLSMQEIDKPTPKDTEVLIRVYAASATEQIIMYSQAGHLSCGCLQVYSNPNEQLLAQILPGKSKQQVLQLHLLKSVIK